MKRYLVNEIFYSLQGEGMRAGTAAMFLRFAKCNLSCSKLTGEGFDCDTDFARGTWMTADEILDEMDRLVVRVSSSGWWVVATGGEPTLQLDAGLISILHKGMWNVAIETNGTRQLPHGLNWVCCSPKRGHKVLVEEADEWKFVMGPSDPLPDWRKGHLLLSPRFNGDAIDTDALDHCIRLIKTDPRWRLSVQQHKYWGVR